MLSDAQWERIAPKLSGKAGDPRSNGRDNRLFMKAFFGLRDRVAVARLRLASGLPLYALLALGAGVSGSGFSRLSVTIPISNMS